MGDCEFVSGCRRMVMERLLQPVPPEVDLMGLKSLTIHLKYFEINK